MTIDTLLHPGSRCVFLRAGDRNGTVRLLAFVAAKRSTLEVWQTPDERTVPPRRTGAFREPLAPVRIARLLASGEAGAHLDPRIARHAVVEGVGDGWDVVLRSAWAHDLASRDPALHALLSVEPGLVDACLARWGERDTLDACAALAHRVEQESRAWLEKWREAIEDVVRRRLAPYEEARVPGELWPSEGEIRRFVERCVLALGRLPRDDEDEGRWAGKDLRISALTPARRERLGLDVASRIGRYRVRVSYLSAIEAHGWDFDQGAGWYLVVTNPHPGWTFNDPVGPYLSPEDAIGDAGSLAEHE